MNNGGLYKNIKMSLKTANLMVLAAIAMLIFCFVLAVGTAEETAVTSQDESPSQVQTDR